MLRRRLADLEYYVDLSEMLESTGSYGSLLGNMFLVHPHELDPKGYITTVEGANIEVIAYRVLAPLKFIPHGGKGFTIYQAVLSALGEAHERTIPGIRAWQPDFYGSVEDLADVGYEVLGPGELWLFAEEQYNEGIPFRKFTRDLRIGWVRAEKLVDGFASSIKALVPAQLMVMGYSRRISEPLIAYSSSAGQVCSTSRLKAIYKGVLEFIERDAINLGWHSDIPPYRVDIDVKKLENLLGMDLDPRDKNVRIYVYLWRHDIEGVYVVSVHLVDLTRKMLVYHPGAAAGISFVEALEGAVAEVIQSYMFLYSIYEIRNTYGKDLDFYYVDEDADPWQADNLFRIVFYYGWPRNYIKLHKEFFVSAKPIGMEKIDKSYIERWSHRWSLMKSIAVEYPLNPYIVDLTPTELESHVVYKVFLSNLTQYNAPRYPYFGHPRYYLAKKLLGISDAVLSYSDLRKVPVPYP